MIGNLQLQGNIANGAGPAGSTEGVGNVTAFAGAGPAASAIAEANDCKGRRGQARTGGGLGGGADGRGRPGHHAVAVTGARAGRGNRVRVGGTDICASPRPACRPLSRRVCRLDRSAPRSARSARGGSLRRGRVRGRAGGRWVSSCTAATTTVRGSGVAIGGSVRRTSAGGGHGLVGRDPARVEAGGSQLLRRRTCRSTP